MSDNIFVGLDLGTTKVCTIVGYEKDNTLDIIGVGSVPSRGMSNGSIVDISKTTEDIAKSLKTAEIMTGIEINDVSVGISGSHISSMNTKVSIKLKNKEISEQDLENIKNKALIEVKDKVLSDQIIHVIPYEFKVDLQTGIKNPIGMFGSTLEASVHIVKGNPNAIQNIIRCTNEAGLNASSIVLEPLASSTAVLTEDEKNMPCIAILDIGGGTADLTVFYKGEIVHSFILAFGGCNITNDIATVMTISLSEAERIKMKYGVASVAFTGSKKISHKGLSETSSGEVSERDLAEIIEARLNTDILEPIKEELMRTGYFNLLSSIVITGGTSLLKNLDQHAEKIFYKPVRIGFPLKQFSTIYETINNPIFSTGIGLVLKSISTDSCLSVNSVYSGYRRLYNKVKGDISGLYRELF